MKKLLLLVILLPNILFAQRQEYNSFPSPFEFTIIDTLPGTQSQLYVKAYEWMTKTFVSAKEVIQMQDKEAGRLIGKGILTMPVRATLGNIVGEDYINFTLSITVKDGKYRCVVSDFIHECGNNYNGSHHPLGNLDGPTPKAFMAQGWMEKRKKDAKTISESKAEDLLYSLKNAMHSKSDNW